MDWGAGESDDQLKENAITSEAPSLDLETWVVFRDRLDGVSVASMVGVTPVELRFGGILSRELGAYAMRANEA